MSRSLKHPHAVFYAAGLGALKGGRSAKWKPLRGTSPQRFTKEAMKVEAVPARRARDFVIRHYEVIAAMIVADVAFVDIWRAATAAGLAVPSPTFYVAVRQFADFLGRKKRGTRRKSEREKWEHLAKAFLVRRVIGVNAATPTRAQSEAAPQPGIVLAEPAASGTAAERRRRELLAGPANVEAIVAAQVRGSTD